MSCSEGREASLPAICEFFMCRWSEAHGIQRQVSRSTQRVNIRGHPSTIARRVRDNGAIKMFEDIDLHASAFWDCGDEHCRAQLISSRLLRHSATDKGKPVIAHQDQRAVEHVVRPSFLEKTERCPASQYRIRLKPVRADRPRMISASGGVALRLFTAVAPSMSGALPPCSSMLPSRRRKKAPARRGVV